MKKISAKGQRWLKCFHVFFACLWLGGAVALTLINFILKADDGMQLYGINLSMKLVDDFVIIPGGVGSLLTGLLYSVFTNWGWFRHKWITTKWAINLFGLIFGTFWLGPWLNALPPISKMEGLKAFVNPVFAHNQRMLYVFGTFQLATIIFAVFISILKPWKRKKIS